MTRKLNNYINDLESRISITSPETILKELKSLTANEVKQYFTIQQILKSVSNSLNIDVDNLKSKSKKHEFVEARNIYYKLCMIHGRNNSKEVSLAYIGSLVNRGHDTVINGLKRYDMLYEVDKGFRYDADSVYLTKNQIK